MNEFVYKLTLDLNCAKTPPVICSGQFDKGRKFEFSITANGEPFAITGCSAVLKGVRTDGSHFAVECSVSNGKIVKILDDTTLSVRGKTVAKLVISDSTKSYSTQMFVIDVDSALDGDITVADDYSILNRLIEQIHALNESGAIIIDDTIDTNSNNAVANKAVAIALANKLEFDDVYTVEEADDHFLSKYDAGLSKFSVRRNYKRNLEVMELPADFNNDDFPLNIYSDGYNFHTDFDVTKYKNKGGTVYYCNTFARGTKDGLSELNATSFLDLSRSGKLSDGDTIILLDGVHQSCNCSSSEESLSIPNVNIIAKNKRKAIVGNIMNNNTITWVNEGNGIYSADLTGTYTTIHNVIQKINDDFSSLKKVENVKDCEVQGTYAYISNVLYVHLFYNEAPIRDNCMICKNYKFPCYEINSESKAITQYLEGVTFIGGTGSTLYVKGTETYKHKVYAKDCDFLYAHDDTLAKDAVSIVGADAYFVGCKAMYSSKDGFNYHKNGNSTPNFVEIDCVGANNGNDGIALATKSYWNNGSTAHEGVKGIRINCVYYNNYGGNVADVSDGTVTLNLGCVAFDSTAVKTHTAACADFVAQQPGATMYLYGCKAFGSTSSAYATAGSTLHIKNCDFENGASGEGAIG